MYKIDRKPDLETVLFDLRVLNISYSDLLQRGTDSSLTRGQNILRQL